jgi:hypothetical protein
MKLPFEIISMEARTGKVRMLMPFGAAAFDAPQQTEGGRAHAEQSLTGALAARRRVSMDDEGTTPQFASAADIAPKETDLVYKNFRALSQTLVECYSLDYSTPGVLEATVPLLTGQTVYKNHNYYDVEKWVGVITQAMWDAQGAESGGVPGINVKIAVDAVMNPRIARGLMMKPPAIHSFSLTVMFTFDFSHPDLVEQGRFWSLLGEEVEGEIVRLIVTKILQVWEGSLVFQGADEIAKQLADDEEDDEAEDEESAEMSARRRTNNLSAGTPRPTQQKGTQTVKVSQDRKTKLGITHEGEDVPDEIVLQRAESLAAQATVAEQMLGDARAECVRVATLAVAGGKDKTLPAALAQVISKAGREELAGLTQMYAEQAAKQFPQVCQSCGTQTVGRSSIEDTRETEGAASQSQTPLVHDPLFS